MSLKSELYLKFPSLQPSSSSFRIALQMQRFLTCGANVRDIVFLVTDLYTITQCILLYFFAWGSKKTVFITFSFHYYKDINRHLKDLQLNPIWRTSSIRTLGYNEPLFQSHPNWSFTTQIYPIVTDEFGWSWTVYLFFSTYNIYSLTNLAKSIIQCTEWVIDVIVYFLFICTLNWMSESLVTFLF